MRKIFMSTKNIFAVFFAMMIAIACSPASTSYDINEEIVFINHSNHSIVISIYDVQNNKPIDISIQVGETSQALNTDLYNYKTCTIKFDNKVVLDYQTLPLDLQNSQYNIFFSNHYYERTEVDEYFYRYTYTSTDADYQFALENGTVLE